MTASPASTLGIDLGGTYARAAVVDAAGAILSSAKSALEDRSPPSVVESVSLAVDEALAGAPGVEVGGCGVGAAAQLRGRTGHVLVAPNLGWREVPLGALLSGRLQRSVVVVNDLSAAAWGELKAGAARGERDVFVVFVGSGVGSAIIANGQLVHGATGVAGELGHTKVVPGGRRCGCGEQGCLEAYAGGRNLILQMNEAVAEHRGGRLLELAGGDPSRLSPAVLEQAAKEGNPAAKEIYERAAGYLGLASANMVTVLNPALLLLGGGVLAHAPGLFRSVEEAVAQLSSWVSRQELKVLPAALGDEAGIIGAALLAREG
ncbi:MAG: ROK family protein [Myxococcales bacterium]|nr:ROK family protein [Myxococcales bacterium]